MITNMRNLKLTLAYDGTEYHGWQTQPVAKTVQKTLENAAESIFKEKTPIIGCSRTDAGVHAREYVCNFFTNCRIEAERVPVALNTKLPPDIRAAVCEEAGQEFNARISAQSKTYRYVINNTGSYDVFSRRYQWFFPKRLDFAKMQSAANHIVGKHDFSAFMTAGSEVLTTVRTVNFLNLTDDNGIITIEINADGFLYNMVRIVAGTLIYAGIGKIDPAKIPGIIASCDRRRAGITAPPQGLCLHKVYYKNGENND